MEFYEQLPVAGMRRQPVSAVDDGLPRLLCPHVLGRNQSHLHALVYQAGGDIHSGLPVTPDKAGVWRCLTVRKLSPGRTPCRGMADGAALVPADLH
jgi:hypothetical protein